MYFLSNPPDKLATCHSKGFCTSGAHYQAEQVEGTGLVDGVSYDWGGHQRSPCGCWAPGEGEGKGRGEAGELTHSCQLFLS